MLSAWKAAQGIMFAAQGCVKAAQSCVKAAKVYVKAASGFVKATPKLVKRWPKVGQKVAQSRPKGCTKLAKVRPKVGQHSPQSRPQRRPGSWPQSRLKVGPKVGPDRLLRTNVPHGCQAVLPKVDLKSACSRPLKSAQTRDTNSQTPIGHRSIG